jgi:hypothetical protein
VPPYSALRCLIDVGKKTSATFYDFKRQRTIGFDLLYAFVIVRLDRRDLVWINVTATPTAEWVARQITEAFPWNEAPRYMIRDRDPRSASSDPDPQVDIGILQRLGFVQPGKMLGDQFGWPEAWIPEPGTRLFFLVDLRDRQRPRAVFLVSDPVRAQAEGQPNTTASLACFGPSEASALNEVVADLTLENRLLKKSLNRDGEDEA